ncbi:MAG: ATP-binding protein [Kofleriaceae bacterium]
MLGTVAAVPVLGLAWWQARNYTEHRTEDWDQLLVERSEDAAEDVQTILQIRLDEIELLAARAESLESWSETSKLRGLFDGRFGAAGFSVLFLGDPWGNSLVASPEMSPSGQPYAGVNYRDRAYFKRMLATGRPAIGDAAIGRRTRTANVSLVAPVHHANGDLRGWVQGTIKLEQLREQVVANIQRNDSRIIVVDAVGSVVVDSAGRLTALAPFVIEPQRGLGGARTLTTVTNDAGTSVRRASAPVTIGDAVWRVYVSTPTQHIAMLSAEMTWATAWATGGALAIALLLVYLVATVASRALQRLSALAIRVGEGDYTVEPRRTSAFTPHEELEVWDAMQDMMRLLEERWHERTRLIQNLEHANEHARSLAAGLRDAHDGFVVLDRELRIDYVNPAWQRLRGRTLEDVLGQRALELDPREGGRPEQLAMIEAALRRDEPWSGTIALRRGDGSLGEADVSFSPVFDDHGRVEHHVALVRDVTAKRQAEQALQQSERLASLGMLAAGVAHEINNPMTYVLGNLEHLKELSEEGALIARRDAELDLPSTLDDSIHGARRVIEIVADLRALSQPRADAGAAASSGLQTVETCLRMAQGQLRHRAEVVRDFPDEDLWFRIIPQRLSQVTLNLILNAAQAMEGRDSSRNKLTVHLRRLPDGRGELSVRDTGCGMSPEIAQRIFDPFFTTKSPGAGTGLGLSITHSIVTAAGGEILVESVPDAGTCFRVRLPLTGSADEESAAERSSLRGLSILVVDDEPGVLTALRRMLAPCRTETAGSVRQALELIERQPFDLVLSDVMMSEATGVELVRALRARASRLASRVCLMSGGIIGGELAQAVKSIGAPLLHKPLTRGELHQALLELHQERAAAEATSAHGAS